MNAHAYLAYGVMLEGEYHWTKIREAVGADSFEPNSDGVTHLSLGDWHGDVIAFNPSVASAYDGSEVVHMDKLTGIDFPAADKAIAKVLERLGHKPAAPKWLLMAYYC